MNPVIQEEKTGCGIASCAAIAGISYIQAKELANSIGIHAEDPSLWSDSIHICRLLGELGFQAENLKEPFKGWEALPDCALLATKWHLEQDKGFWHWAVFRREKNEKYILDSKKGLKANKRTDFGRIKPKWYIEVNA